jgi:hypothetical protein
MSLYSDAVASIRTRSEYTQIGLNHSLVRLRQANIETLRRGFVANIAEDSPLHPLAQYLANTVHIGRESDNYPSINVTTDCKKLLQSAINADLIPVTKDSRYFKIGAIEFCYPELEATHEYAEWQADYEAWQAAKEYRKRQSWQTL